MPAADAAAQQQVHALYSEHHGWLRGWLRRRLGDAHHAADLAHDTFVRLIAARRESFGPQPRALLTHIAKGLVVDHWRRQDVERVYLDALAQQPEPLAPSPEARLMIIESLMRIDAMLAGLPGRTREVFMMAQLDGLTLQEIAARTGIPVITVRRHIHKALVACMAAVSV